MGLNTSGKRHQILRELQRISSSIVFLQETHLTQFTSTCIKSAQYPIWYYSLSDTKKAKGVAIGFHKNTSFILDQLMIDDHGRFFLLQGDDGWYAIYSSEYLLPEH